MRLLLVESILALNLESRPNNMKPKRIHRKKKKHILHIVRDMAQTKTPSPFTWSNRAQNSQHSTLVSRAPELQLLSCHQRFFPQPAVVASGDGESLPDRWLLRCPELEPACDIGRRRMMHCCSKSAPFLAGCSRLSSENPV